MKGTIHLAWTIDDGPTHLTPGLMKAMLDRQIEELTFFVAASNFHKNKWFQNYAAANRDKIEIAIHEVHPHKEGINWFSRTLNAYDKIELALADLDIFCDQLKQLAFCPSFVRLPGGELSELVWYLRMLGCPQGQDFETARDIIDGKEVDAKFAPVKRDYKKLIRELSTRKLKIWNGSADTFPLLGGADMFSYNSWQAESAGVAEGRGADNITRHQAGSRAAAGIRETNFGVFEKLADRLIPGNGGHASIIVLSHDKTIDDVEEILADVDQIIAYAKTKQIEVKFHTLSGLYKIIRSQKHEK